MLTSVISHQCNLSFIKYFFSLRFEPKAWSLNFRVYKNMPFSKPGELWCENKNTHKLKYKPTFPLQFMTIIYLVCISSLTYYKSQPK